MQSRRPTSATAPGGEREALPEPASQSAPESAPESARTIFGDQFPTAARYAYLLCTTGVARGLIGPREAGRIWSRHLLNAAALAELIPADARVLDVGSGAGLPGIPLALARPDLSMILLEPMQRRVTFLQEVIEALHLPVEVRRGRVEELGAPIAEVAVARAVAPLARLATWVAPALIRPGLLLALKGEAADEELAAARTVLSALGATDAHSAVIGSGVAQTRVVSVVFSDSGSPHGRRRGGRGGR